MAKKKIEIRCEGADLLPLDMLCPLQGNLKLMSPVRKEKLKTSLIENGFWFPFFVWYCKEENKHYFIDGHQRDKVLPEIQKKDGYQIPEKYPVVFIEANNKREAVKAILLQSSGYGFTDSAELDSLIVNYQLDIDDLSKSVNIPGIEIEDFKNKDFFPVDKSEQPRLDEKKSVICPECGYEFKPK